MKSEEMKQRIRKRLMSVINACNQTIAEKQWWNNNRLDQPPFDIGFETVLLNLTQQELESFERGDYVDAQRLSRAAAAFCKEHAGT